MLQELINYIKIFKKGKEMNNINEKDLEQVSGGEFSEIVNTEDVLSFIKVLSERPGIVERLRASILSEEDEQTILTYFLSVNRFIMVARLAHNKTIVELMAIASANDNR